MSPTIHAKFVLSSIERHPHSEILKFRAVPKSAYDASGVDEANNYAKFDAWAECSILVANPALIGKYSPGQRFDVEITPCNPSPSA